MSTFPPLKPRQGTRPSGCFYQPRDPCACPLWYVLLMAGGNEAAVFISYAHQDGAALAAQLQGDLAKLGWDVWLDSARLIGGASWTVEIEQTLDRSDFVLAILSRGSYRSDTCRAEQLRSLRKGKCLIPILAQADAERPIHLESKQYIDFTTAAAYDMALSHLCESLRARSGASLPSRFHQTYVTVPPLPPNYIERTAELRSLRALVLRDGGGRTVALTALKGMAGIGKTVLAQALCLDEVTQAAFPDGIIWLPLGKDPKDPVPLLREAAKAIGDSLEGYDSPQSASNRLRSCLRNKAALLVLDDVWDPRDVAPFLFDSATSRLIITTRDGRTATALGAEQQELAVLTWEQSLDLIALWANCERAKLPKDAADIVRECGCLPLAVAMVGAQLRGKPDRWPLVLHKLQNADLDRIRQSFPEYPHPDLLRAIDVSMEALPEELCRRYLDFGVFPEDCAIPEAAAATLWGLGEYETADSLDQLVDLSLLTRDSGRRLRLHDLMLDYLRRRLGADSLTSKHRQLLDRYAQRCSGSWPQGPNDGYFFENLIWHLRSAGQSGEALGLLTNFAWMDAKLDACGITPLVADYDWFSSRDENARLLHEALRLSAYVLANDRRQLPGQLLGRLAENSSPAIDNVRRQALQYSRGFWLRPSRCLLTPPGGALIFTLASHTARVRSLALTLDGTKAISGSDDHTLKIWDLRRGKLDRTIIGHTDAVRSVAVLPDGERAISASDDHTLRIWDVSSGAQLGSMDIQLDWIRGLVALPRIAWVASISDDRAIRIWDLDQGRVVRILRGHAAEVNCAAVMPSGESLVTGADDRTLRIWTVDGACTSILKGHAARIAALAVSESGRIVSISEDGGVWLWNESNGWQPEVLSWNPQGVRTATFSPDGTRIIAGADDGNVHVWDFNTKTERVLEGHSDWVNCVASSPDGRFAVSASDDGTLKLWDLTRVPAAVPVRDHTDRVRAVAILSDGVTAISSSDDHKLCIWDRSTYRVHTPIRNQHHWVFACTPDAKGVVSAGSAGAFSLWELATMQEVKRFAGHDDRVRCLAVTRCGTRVISGGDDGTVRVWDVQSAHEILRIRLTRQWPRAIAVTPDSRFVVTAAESAVLKLWSLESGAEVRTFRGHTARANSVALTDNGLLISGSDDHSVRVWDLETASPLHVCNGHDGRVNSVACLSGGRFAVSACDDCDINVWDLTKGVLVATHTVESPVLACAANPSGTEIVAGDRSGLVHFISLEAGSSSDHDGSCAVSASGLSRG
jgi:WD40 repeat protein